MPLFERIARLENERVTFAIATVVARRSPVSSHIGDRALIFLDGRMEGFVGGSCSRDIVRRQALAAIRSRRPRLLQIRSDADPAESAPTPNAERVIVPMSCASEGAVDVYIEPSVPHRRLVVAGFTPVACEIARLAAGLGYEVLHVVAGDELGDAVPALGGRVLALGELRELIVDAARGTGDMLLAVVASQGHYDEAALEILLEARLEFVGLLASRRRAKTVLGVLAQQGVSAERLATIRTPVGLDIGARNPAEVAVSVLAEIIAHAPQDAEAVDEASPAASAVAKDPVCGMEVELAAARHRYEHGGLTYYFCCAGCRSAFASDPDGHLATAGKA